MSMHVLFFIQSLSGGGAERVTVNLANHWVARGWKVTIVTMAGVEKDAYALAPEIHRIGLNVAGESPGLVVAMKNNLRRMRALRRVLRDLRPDVAIGMMATASCLLALVGHNGVKILIGAERTYPPRLPLGKTWEAVRRYFYRYLDSVVVLSSESRNWVYANTSARQVVIISNPVVFPLSESLPIISPSEYLEPERKKILAVGRLEGVKGFDRLLRAFAELAGQHLQWDLVIVGEGSLRGELEAKARDLQIDARLILPGRAGNVADWYKAADLYAMTSLYEGFPNVLVEAMAHGLPVVSVDCDTGPRDIITSGKDGILVPQGDHAALVEALHNLMADPDKRHRLGKKALEIRERLSLDRITREWEKVMLANDA